MAGVVLMFVFVLGDPLSQYLRSHSAGPGGAGRSPNAAAVKWNGGQLTNAELNQLVVQRLVVNNFLRTVEGDGIQAAQQSGAEPQPLRVGADARARNDRKQGVERDVLRTYLMAEAARKAGMAISDEYIVSYLQQLGRGFVSVDMIRQILISREVGGRQASIDYVLDARASRNAGPQLLGQLFLRARNRTARGPLARLAAGERSRRGRSGRGAGRVAAGRREGSDRRGAAGVFQRV